MQTLMTLPEDPPSPWDIPVPILFNTWKHHAGAIRHRIREYVARDPSSLMELAAELIVIGTKLMDLYVGRYAPAELAQLVLEQLERNQRLDREALRAWVERQGGYGMLELDDGSRWVVRVADEADRYVHLHPGRWVPQTRRVRANVLKTAVMTLAHTGIHGGDPLDLALVNRVRLQYLGLSPMGRDLDGDQGIGEVIDLLRGGER
jgi:hypothetical protein